ncbi:hypothetical protein [Methanosarcina mazei]|uniref:hypothetical protein n=1 Tax=Methanosarcina mazei TaxID=2209 RepID=UPI000A6C5F38|nr:hypothetical protein [Methanosarcina mazei]
MYSLSTQHFQQIFLLSSMVAVYGLLFFLQNSPVPVQRGAGKKTEDAFSGLRDRYSA